MRATANGRVGLLTSVQARRGSPALAERTRSGRLIQPGGSHVEADLVDQYGSRRPQRRNGRPCAEPCLQRVISCSEVSGSGNAGLSGSGTTETGTGGSGVGTGGTGGTGSVAGNTGGTGTGGSTGGTAVTGGTGTAGTGGTGTGEPAGRAELEPAAPEVPVVRAVLVELGVPVGRVAPAGRRYGRHQRDRNFGRGER